MPLFYMYYFVFYSYIACFTLGVLCQEHQKQNRWALIYELVRYKQTTPCNPWVHKCPNICMTRMQLFHRYLRTQGCPRKSNLTLDPQIQSKFTGSDHHPPRWGLEQCVHKERVIWMDSSYFGRWQKDTTSLSDIVTTKKANMAITYNKCC